MSANETAAIDEAWAKADPAATAAAGYRAVLGYCSRDTSKIITGPYRAACRAAGLCVGLVFEDGATRALGGAVAGAADGAIAEQQANAAGYDINATLFFAVDFNASAAQIAGPIRDYAVAFDAATRRPVGVYGSKAVVDALVTPGVRPVRYGWQTAAWSGGLLSAKANIYQRVGHVNWPLIAGMAANAFDEDVITAPIPLDGGTLTPPGKQPAPAPTPAPPAPPLPPPAPPHPLVLAWNLGPGNYYGNIAGPAASHGGAVAWEKTFVRNIQQWLIFHGCADGQPPGSWATNPWADGVWGHPTDTAMANWHARFYPGQPQPAQCWSDDYVRLARP